MDDIVIVGGGIIGAASAYFLSKEGRKVKVIERDPTYKKASFPLSLGGFRRQFFQKENILLGKYEANKEYDNFYIELKKYDKKLYEELFYDTEETPPTSNSAILLAPPKRVAHDLLYHKIDKLYNNKSI